MAPKIPRRRIGIAALAVPVVLSAVLSTVLSLALSVGARAEEQAIGLTEDDWPCHGKYRLEFSAGAYWQEPALGPASAAWREDAEVRKLAEQLVASGTMEPEARRLIADFGQALPRDPARNPRLARLFHGVLDETNLYRRFVLEGIVGFVARHRLAARVLAGTEAELQSLPNDGTAGTAAARKALEERRFWQARVVEDAVDEARFLCHRLNSLDAKLGMLARAITAQLGPS